MLLAIDFDGVLHDIDNPVEGRRMGAPIEGARESMLALEDDGHTLVIHTVRAVVPIDEGYDEALARRVKHIEDWLEFYHIPYHEVTAIKPNADAFLDNKGIHFVSWGSAMQSINDLITL